MPQSSPSQLRQFVSALLLRAIKDAADGDLKAQRWLRSKRAAAWGEELSLRYWPPDLEQARQILDGR